MPSLRRIVVALGIVFMIGVLVTQWILPVTMSFQAARKPPSGSWLVPRELPDHSISSAPGTKLSYFGSVFEVPWTDVDDAKTKSYPDAALLTFHSGLKLMIGASPQKFLRGDFFGKSKIMQVGVDQTFGIHSDYDFFSQLYNFTPDKIHLWAISPSLHYRDMFMLELKSKMLPREAETGFFYIGNSNYKGFQEGDPAASSNYHPQSKSSVFIRLFSDQGCLNLTLFQKDFQNPTGVSQSEINRIIQSVHRVDGSPKEKATTSHN